MTKTFRLPNGITVVCEERPKTGKVSMLVNFKYGSANEAADESGLTFLMQEACNAGTMTRTRAQLAEEAKFELVTVTSQDTTTFGTSKVLTRYAEEAFAIITDVVRHPAFEAAEVEKTKAQIAEWIDKDSKSPQKKTEIKFLETAFAEQAAGGDPRGNRALLNSFTPAQIRQKHAELLAHPENIVISFTGDIDSAQAQKLAQDYFGDLPAAVAAAKDLSVKFTDGDYREATENEQLNLRFGFKAPARRDADSQAVFLLQEFLSGGMSSPLFMEVRERRGLVYSVHAGYNPFADTGVFSIIAGAGKGNAGELISVTMGLLGKIIRDGVDPVALDQARERILRSIKQFTETAADAAERNSNQIMSFGRLISLEETEQQLKKVTSDDLRRICADMLRDGKYALSGIGPQETMPTAAEIKNMMQAQLQGVTVPIAQPVTSSVKPEFSRAAKETKIATVEPKMTTLKNGMKIVTVERPGNLSCGAWVGAGSDHEPPALNGATHMNEHMMFKGTPSYEPGEIDRIVDGELGGGLNAYTTNDRTAYYFYNLKADALEKIVDICGEMVFKAKLDHAEFDGKPLKNPDGTTVKAKGERDVVIEEMKMYKDDVGDCAFELAMATAYPNQPHGRSVIGTEETLRAMTVEQLAAYRDEYYAPNNVVFSAAGPIKHEDFVAIVEKNFGQMQAKNFPALPVPDYKGGAAFIEHQNASLCSVNILAESVAAADPDTAAYEALGEILGGGTSSRFYTKIVDELGLSSSVGAGTFSLLNGGNFIVSASVAPDKVRSFVSAVYAEMRSLGDSLTQVELDKVKVSMETDLLSDLETNDDACRNYASNVQAYGRLVTQPEQLAQIQKLSLDDIKRVLKKVLASSPTLAMAVPPGTDPQLLPKQDEVVAMRDGKRPPSNTSSRNGPVV